MWGQNLMGQMGQIGRPHIRLRLRHMCSLFPAVLHSPIMTNQSLASDIRRYAIAGAKARVVEITQELDAIRRAFPELRENGSRGARTRQSAVAGGDEPTTPARRRRSSMSAAQRKAVGERMKKYWAARRAGTGTTSAAATVEGNGTPKAKVTRAAKGAKRGTPSAAAARCPPPRGSDFAGAEEAVGG